MADATGTERTSDAAGGESESKLPDGLRRALVVEGGRYDLLFTVFLLLVVGTFLGMTPQYEPQTQLFPLVIGVPTFLLLLGLLLLQSSSRARAKVERFTTTDVFGMQARLGDIDRPDDDGESDVVAQRVRVLGMAGWVLLLGVLIFLFGFLPAMLLFMLAFYRVRADQPWSKTVTYSVVTWLVIVLIFSVALNTPFYQGVFDISVPIPF